MCTKEFRSSSNDAITPITTGVGEIIEISDDSDSDEDVDLEKMILW